MMAQISMEFEYLFFKCLFLALARRNLMYDLESKFIAKANAVISRDRYDSFLQVFQDMDEFLPRLLIHLVKLVVLDFEKLQHRVD
jgi:hypothetical protein